MNCDAKCVISGSIETVGKFLYWSNILFSSIQQSQLTTIKVCIQAASKMTKVTKVAQKLQQKLWNGRKMSKLRCTRSQFSGRSSYSLLCYIRGDFLLYRLINFFSFVLSA